MTRILLTMAALSTALLIVAFATGFQIADPTVNDPAIQAVVSRHMLTSLAALVFAAFVHALVLTYFMGTGRWIEETSTAYRLAPDWKRNTQSIKYRVIPAMVGCLLLLVATGATGTAADPASPVAFGRGGPFSPSRLHLVVSSITLAVNLLVHLQELAAIRRNGELVTGILAEVKRIRSERGLPD